MKNQIPVLDKGFVSLLGASLTDENVRHLWRRYTVEFNKQLLAIPTAHIEVRCPLFVQLQFAQHNLHTLVKKKQGKPEAFIPTEVEIQARDLEASQAIAADMKQTTEALLLNPRAYQFEACDTFISQVISPISVYNTLVVSGTLQQWMSFLHQEFLPAPIEAYRKAIEDILVAEWSSLEQWIRRDDSTKKS